MKAVILAAGRGSRLLTLTKDQPKCMVEVNGRPLLHWQMEALEGAGINSILVVRGYRQDMIVGDFETTENPRWFETNMVASLLCARQWLMESDCIVSYSDIIYSAGAVERLIQTEAPLAILYDPNWLKLWRERFDDPLSDAESFAVKENLVLDIGRSNVSYDQIEGQYIGLLKYSPRSFRWITDILDRDPVLHDSLDMTALLQILIEDGKPITGIAWEGKWCEVDRPKDLEVAKKLFD